MEEDDDGFPGGLDDPGSCSRCGRGGVGGGGVWRWESQLYSADALG